MVFEIVQKYIVECKTEFFTFFTFYFPPSHTHFIFLLTITLLFPVKEPISAFKKVGELSSVVKVGLIRNFGSFCLTLISY